MIASRARVSKLLLVSVGLSADRLSETVEPCGFAFDSMETKLERLSFVY